MCNDVKNCLFLVESEKEPERNWRKVAENPHFNALDSFLSSVLGLQSETSRFFCCSLENISSNKFFINPNTRTHTHMRAGAYIRSNDVNINHLKMCTILSTRIWLLVKQKKNCGSCFKMHLVCIILDLRRKHNEPKNSTLANLEIFHQKTRLKPNFKSILLMLMTFVLRLKMLLGFLLGLI